MIVDVTLVARDVAASFAFYDAVLGTLGLVRVAELVDEEEDGGALEAVGWGNPDGAAELWVVGGTAPTSSLHVRLKAHSRPQVEAFAQHAEVNGGTVMSGPRRWMLYRSGEYAATVRDPDGNTLEAVAPE